MDCKHASDLSQDILAQRGETPLLIMPVAPSGAGKTTFATMLIDGGFAHFSLDLLRFAWYDQEDYTRAYSLSCEDPKFSVRANQEYIALVKAKKDIVIDNMSLVSKRRIFYLTEAHRHGYKSIAVLFPCKVVDLVVRQCTRGDKSLIADTVHAQHLSLTLPSYGEFHDIVMVIDNIEV